MSRPCLGQCKTKKCQRGREKEGELLLLIVDQCTHGAGKKDTLNGCKVVWTACSNAGHECIENDAVEGGQGWRLLRLVHHLKHLHVAAAGSLQRRVHDACQELVVAHQRLCLALEGSVECRAQAQQCCRCLGYRLALFLKRAIGGGRGSMRVQERERE